MPSLIQSSMYFLERDPLYKKEKPYQLNYTPLPGQPKTNMKVKKNENMQICDIRGREQEFTFAKNGFTLVGLNSGMQAADFEDKSKVTGKYLPLVAETVKQSLHATRVQIFDYVIRKRHEKFPVCTGGFYNFKQPSSIVHVDTTPRQTEDLLQEMNPIEAEKLSQMHYQYVNIWKPLRGPVHDWPLGLCDPMTMDGSEYQARDIVEEDSVMETYQIHASKSQKWYFVSEQSDQEAWIFLQSDSNENGMKGVAHSAFPIPLCQGSAALPRESIEVRALVFYE